MMQLKSHIFRPFDDIRHALLRTIRHFEQPVFVPIDVDALVRSDVPTQTIVHSYAFGEHDYVLTWPSGLTMASRGWQG